MKKRGKLIGLLLGFIVGSQALVACSHDDDNHIDVSDRIIGTWIGESSEIQETEADCTAGYVFEANGKVVHYERFLVPGTQKLDYELNETGVYTVNGIKLVITWNHVSYYDAVSGRYEENVNDIDEIVIMYPKQETRGMYLKRYFPTHEGPQGWSEEGPFYKK